MHQRSGGRLAHQPLQQLAAHRQALLPALLGVFERLLAAPRCSITSSRSPYSYRAELHAQALAHHIRGSCGARTRAPERGTRVRNPARRSQGGAGQVVRVRGNERRCGGSFRAGGWCEGEDGRRDATLGRVDKRQVAARLVVRVARLALIRTAPPPPQSQRALTFDP